MLLSSLLSVIALLIGLIVGSLYWTFHLGLGWLRRVLLDESALSAFWLLHFEPKGGLTAILRGEGIVLDESNPTTAMTCAIAIRVEAEIFVKMRRLLGFSLFVLCLVFLFASAYTSVAVTVCFFSGVMASIPLRNRSYAIQSLATLFRSVRIWMGADPEPLDQHGPESIRGIARIIEAHELMCSAPDKTKWGR
jgi:hypothetical protein